MTNKKPKIPQNKKENFIFIIMKEENYIDIQFDHNKSINITNLFLIIKTYLNNDYILIKNIFVNSSSIEFISSGEFKINLFHNVNIKDMSKFSYYDFKNWFERIKESDYEYIKTLKYYGFRIVLYKESIIWEESKVYPIYPWKPQFKAIYFQKKIKLESWMFLKDKNLYRKWKLINKKKAD